VESNQRDGKGHREGVKNVLFIGDVLMDAPFLGPLDFISNYKALLLQTSIHKDSSNDGSCGTQTSTVPDALNASILYF